MQSPVRMLVDDLRTAVSPGVASSERAAGEQGRRVGVRCPDRGVAGAIGHVGRPACQSTMRSSSSSSIIPIVDWRQLETDRAGFLAAIRVALGDIGFMVVKNAPGFEPGVQQRTFRVAHSFFDSSAEIRERASIARTPYMRGYDQIVQTPSQLIETFQYGPDVAPVVADHTDKSVPIWRRMFYGPQTWPDERALPEFRGVVRQLCDSYLKFHHQLGELICDSVGAPPGAYDTLFDRLEPIPLAFLGRSYSLEHVHRGGLAMNRRPVKSGDEGVAEMVGNINKGAGGHVDITPFMALLTMDSPGLQVQAKGGMWVDMPVVPGAVCVNVGSTLQHLSGGKMVATMHRVNTALIPSGSTRVSAPFFLMPRFDVELRPWVDTDNGDGEQTDYISQDRGLAAAFNRMTLFRSCTRAFWAKEFAEIKEQQTQLALQENLVVAKKIKRQGIAIKQSSRSKL